jgi:hypothetical protein
VRAGSGATDMAENCTGIGRKSARNFAVEPRAPPHRFRGRPSFSISISPTDPNTVSSTPIHPSDLFPPPETRKVSPQQLRPYPLMKTSPLLFLAMAMAPLACAADLSLADGRVLKDATIVSQTPRTVIVKHAGGLGSVAKDLLPAELRARYPLDEAAARQADERAAQAAAAARDAEQAAAESRAQRLAQAREATAARQAADDEAEAREKAQLAMHRANASALVERYFEQRNRWNSGMTKCEVSIDEFRPLDGWVGQWKLTGQVVIKHYTDEDLQHPVRRLQNPADIRRQAHIVDFPHNTQLQLFEAAYSTDGEEPAVSVTLR